VKIMSAGCAGAVFSLIFFAGNSQAFTRPYQFTALHAANGYTNTEPTAINDFGQVVGISFNTNLESSQATIWIGNSASPLISSGFGVSQAFGINNAGQVVGGANISSTDNDWHAIVWNSAGPQDLGPGNAFAINTAGQVAGTNGSQRATIWNGTTPTTIGSGPDQTGAINSSGQVAGSSGYDAVVWNNGIKNPLPGLGGIGARAQAINDLGVSVGYSWIPGNSTYHATIWNGTGVIDLGSLGGGQSRALGINNTGTIVGDSTTATGFQHATLWTAMGPVDLNSFIDPSTIGKDWTLAVAVGINAEGSITGISRNYFSGQWEGFILKPIPEPKIHYMMLFGLGLLGAIVICKK
jgi:probable HAF family extracellular repeat protein